MVNDDDWRLQGQERALMGKTLYLRHYKAYSDKWEHDHCTLCWEEFSDHDSEDTLHEGYTTADNYHWVCKTCFKDFRDMFHWEVGE